MMFTTRLNLMFLLVLEGTATIGKIRIIAQLFLLVPDFSLLVSLLCFLVSVEAMECVKLGRVCV